VPSYSSAWPSAENFAAVASLPILASQSPFSSLTFSVLISSRLEKRSLVTLPPLVIQLAPASSFSSSEVNSGAAAMPPSSTSGVSASAGSGSSAVVVVLVAELLPPPPQPATTRAPSKARRDTRINPLRHPLPIKSASYCSGRYWYDDPSLSLRLIHNIGRM